MPATIYGQEVPVEVGSVIKPDNWRLTVKLKESDWSECQFRMPSFSYPEYELAVNVKVTGRTWQRREGEYWVRVEIEFVHDGEPNVKHGGWLLRTW